MTTDGGSSPTLRLRALGREDVVRVGSCGDTCVPVELIIEGGTPPYRIRWDDGEVGAKRTLCIDPARSRSVSVIDASDGPPASLGLPPVEVDPPSCGTNGVLVCQRLLPTVDHCSSRSLVSLDLGRTFDASTHLSGVLWAPTPQAQGGPLELWWGSEACGMEFFGRTVGLYETNPPSGVGALEFSGVQSDLPLRHVALVGTYGPLGPLGPLTGVPPTEFSFAEVCEHGLAMP